MGFFSGAAGILAIIALMIILPSTVISAIVKNTKNKRDFELEKLKYQKEMIELELQKQQNQIKLLQEENKKYDNLINGE